jgi:MFS transporter, SP family, inositol transporter
VRLGATETTGWQATVSVAMSNYIEAGSIIAIAVSLTLWQDHFGFGDFAVGLLAAVSANAFGAAAGAIVGGWLCDRLGRKFIYTYDLLVYMLGVLLAVFAVSYGMLLAAFVITGLAVGAGVPASWTYIAEQAPAQGRARHVGTAQLAWSIGPTVGFALAIAVVPLGLLGSRLIFAHLFVVAGVTWWLRQGLSESQEWREDQEAAQEQAREQPGAPGGHLAGVRGLLSQRHNVTALLFCFGVYGFWNLVAGQAGIFMPRVYDAAGLSSAAGQNALQVVVWGCTSAATVLGFMRFGDRVSRRRLYILGAVLGIAAWALLAYAEATLATLVAFAVVWGVSAGLGAQAFYSVWTSELFATRHRATAQGLLFFAARVVVGLMSYVFPTLLTHRGVEYVGTLMLVSLTVALVVGAVWAPDTQGKSLREIERSRAPVGAS